MKLAYTGLILINAFIYEVVCALPDGLVFTVANARLTVWHSRIQRYVATERAFKQTTTPSTNAYVRRGGPMQSNAAKEAHLHVRLT